MRVAVLGAGVVGVCAAWYLSQDGHAVTVFDERPGAGLGTSYGNAGQIWPALSSPWAFSGLLRKAAGWLASPHSPLVIGRMPDGEMLRFLWRMWRASDADRYLSAKRSMVELAEYSRDRMRDLRAQTGIAYHDRQRGILVAFRRPEQPARYEKDLKVLESLGVPFERLDATRVLEFEPDLAGWSGVLAGVHLPADETGDCRLFTARLADALAAGGADIRYGTAVHGLRAAGNRIAAVRTGDGELEFDAVVVALGTGSRALLEPLGIDRPIYPVKGYSLTIEADAQAVGPRGSVADETTKVGVTNFGSRIRVGGTAELAGHDAGTPERRYRTLLHTVRTLFPKITDAALASAERWSGLRPVTPAGPPLIGRSRFENLFLDTGHGALGWTMAAGSGKALCDALAGRRPVVDLSPFSPNS